MGWHDDFLFCDKICDGSGRVISARGIYRDGDYDPGSGVYQGSGTKIAEGEVKTWSEIAKESGLPCGIVACPQCGKVISGYLAPDLVCVCGYKFFERKEKEYES